MESPADAIAAPAGFELEGLPLAIVVADAAGRLQQVNRAAAELLGRAARDLVGQTLDALEGSSRHDGDGSPPVLLDAHALPDGRRMIVLREGAAGPVRRAAASGSEQELRFVVDAVPALLAFVDADARYVWANESYRRWFGQSPDAIRGRHVSEVLGPAAWEQIRERVARVLAGEEVMFENWAIYRHGPARYVHVTYLPHRDADGRVRGFVVMVSDASQRKLAETALRHSQRMLAESQTAARVGSWEATVDEGPVPNARDLRWSDENYRMFGFEPGRGDITYKRFMEAIHPDDRAATAASAAAGIARGGRFEKEYRVVRPDGGVRQIRAWTNVERDPAGGPVRLLGTCQDVTETKRAEREMQRALQELKEADRHKDEFLAMLSHELRNPLAPILSAVEILRLVDQHDGAASARYRTVIEQQVQHMKRLLDDLLDVSRVSQGKIELRKEVLELGDVLSRAVEVSRPLMDNKSQTFAMRAARGTVLVEADPTRLVQVFANLLNNAAKYSERGGHVELELGIEEDEAIVRVRDRGVGMTPELLERAFELFVQETRSLDRAQGGLGIGLTMVRSLVKMHGGSVRAVSDGPGRGCEIVVRLPRARADAVPARSAAPAMPASGPLRVLVVDDNEDAARTLGELLALLGHEVKLAFDGPTALAVAATVAPEVVLIDIGLPGMDGYALAAALRTAGLGRAALVAVTGYGRDEDLRRSSAAGFDHHLVKPVALAALVAIMSKPRSAVVGG